MFVEDQESKVAITIEREATGISDGLYKNNRDTAICIIEANGNT